MLLYTASIFNTLILILIFSFLYLYWLLKKAERYFNESGIPHIKLKILINNIIDMAILRKPVATAQRNLYQKLAPYKYVGFFSSGKPFVMVRDPELIKNVTTKDFSYFLNRGIEIKKDTEPLQNHLFNMKGDEWKNLRIKLTSTFTTGKMKMMFPLMTECANKLEYVLDRMATNAEVFEIKDLCARYTTDVIGSCAFGIETHSLDDPNSGFRRMGKRIFEFRYRTILRGLFPNMPTKLIKLLRMECIPPDVGEYFTSLVESVVSYRQENNVTRCDFLDLLIALRNNTQMKKFKDQHEEEDLHKFLEQTGDKHTKNNVDMTVDLMAAQCFLFFGAGFETSSSTLSFLLLELAYNRDIQRKVREEITTTLDKHGGLFTYETLKEMNYTDMVISETLRKYPPAGFLMRQCSENYRIPDSTGVIKKGAYVMIPVYGLHADKQYYEKPEEFCPEHFTVQAKSERHHYAYIPFGEGPRVCIAERFAKMQIKVGLVCMLQNHEFQLAPRMKMPVKFANNLGLLTVKDGIWVTCKNI